VTTQDDTVAAGGVQLVDTPGRPARPVKSERGEHLAESVLSLNLGAGPGQSGKDHMPPPCSPARPDRPPGYWARVDAIVAQAPALTPEQRAIIRTAFTGATARVAA